MQFPFHYFLPPGGWLGPVSRHPFVRMYGMCRKGRSAVHKPAHIPGLHIREKFRVYRRIFVILRGNPMKTVK